MLTELTLCVSKILDYVRLRHCAVIPSFYLTVKYLREVTPYFRKASVLADVGWELQSGFLGAQNGFLATTPNTNSSNSIGSSSVDSAATATAAAKEKSALISSPDTRSLTLLFCHLTRNYKSKGSKEILQFSLICIPFYRTSSLLFCCHGATTK